MQTQDAQAAQQAGHTSWTVGKLQLACRIVSAAVAVAAAAHQCTVPMHVHRLPPVTTSLPLALWCTTLLLAGCRSFMPKVCMHGVSCITQHSRHACASTWHCRTTEEAAGKRSSSCALLLPQTSHACCQHHQQHLPRSSSSQQQQACLAKVLTTPVLQCFWCRSLRPTGRLTWSSTQMRASPAPARTGRSCGTSHTS